MREEVEKGGGGGGGAGAGGPGDRLRRRQRRCSKVNCLCLLWRRVCITLPGNAHIAAIGPSHPLNKDTPHVSGNEFSFPECKWSPCETCCCQSYRSLLSDFNLPQLVAESGEVEFIYRMLASCRSFK